MTLNGMIIESVAYNSTKKTLTIGGLQNMTTSGAWASEWALSWM